MTEHMEVDVFVVQNVQDHFQLKMMIIISKRKQYVIYAENLFMLTKDYQKKNVYVCHVNRHYQKISVNVKFVEERITNIKNNVRILFVKYITISSLIH